MLIQILTHQPQMLTHIVKGTPIWVWGLLVALLALGISQLADRTPSLRRVVLVPVAMLGFALFGMVSAFGSGPQLGPVALAWAAAAIAATGLMLQLRTPAGTRFDAASASFWVPGSSVPLLLILGIFLTKYIVGIELALNPAQARDASFVLPVGLLYGAFNGIFIARAVRLLRLARQSAAPRNTTLAA
jgi:hypothetical protein